MPRSLLRGSSLIYALLITVTGHAGSAQAVTISKETDALLRDLDLVASDAKIQEGPIEQNQRLLSEISTRFSLHPDEKDGIRRQLEARWNGVSGTPESRLFNGVAVAYVTDDSDLAKTVYNQAPRKSWRRAVLTHLVIDDLLKAKRYAEILEAGYSVDFSAKAAYFKRGIEQTPGRLSREMVEQMVHAQRAKLRQKHLATLEALAGTNDLEKATRLGRDLYRNALTSGEKDSIKRAVERAGAPGLWAEVQGSG